MTTKMRKNTLAVSIENNVLNAQRVSIDKAVMVAQRFWREMVHYQKERWSCWSDSFFSSFEEFNVFIWQVISFYMFATLNNCDSSLPHTSMLSGTG